MIVKSNWVKTAEKNLLCLLRIDHIYEKTSFVFSIEKYRSVAVQYSAIHSLLLNYMLCVCVCVYVFVLLDLRLHTKRNKSDLKKKLIQICNKYCDHSFPFQSLARTSFPSIALRVYQCVFYVLTTEIFLCVFNQLECWQEQYILYAHYKEQYWQNQTNQNKIEQKKIVQRKTNKNEKERERTKISQSLVDSVCMWM